MTLTGQQRIVSLVSLMVIALATLRLWHHHGVRTDINVPLQEAVGEQLAAQVNKYLGGRGTIAVAVLAKGQSEESDIQFRTFETTLAKLGAVVIDNLDHVDAEGRAKYGPGRGLSARRLSRMIGKYTGVQALVSFIGTPDPDDLKDHPLPAGHPPLIALTRSPKDLRDLIDSNVVHSAIVPRYDFPAPGPENPTTRQMWFDKYYQVLEPLPTRPAH